MKSNVLFKEIDRLEIFEDAPKNEEIRQIIDDFLSTGYNTSELKMADGRWFGVSMIIRITRYAEKHGYPVEARTKYRRSYIMRK